MGKLNITTIFSNAATEPEHTQPGGVNKNMIALGTTSNNNILYKRDNYKKWPWKKILFTLLVCGVICLLAGKETHFLY